MEAVFPGAADLAARYVDLLATTGVEWGLVGPRETDRLWERHVFNSAALADLVPADASVVDVGSGAGLPGIPLALRRPDLRVDPARTPAATGDVPRPGRREPRS